MLKIKDKKACTTKFGILTSITRCFCLQKPGLQLAAWRVSKFSGLRPLSVGFSFPRPPRRLILATVSVFAWAGSGACDVVWKNPSFFSNAAVSSIDWEKEVEVWRKKHRSEKDVPSAPSISSPVRLPSSGSDVQRLLALIERVESPRHGYNAVHFSAKRLPPARPTELTLMQIFDWIRKTPNQHHAIGRYQIVPDTLAGLVRKENISLTAKFTPALQDRFAIRLLQEKGLQRFKAGLMSDQQFMDAVASVWAGFPTSSGKSLYHGKAGNRATISLANYKAAWADIFRGGSRPVEFTKGSFSGNLKMSKTSFPQNSR